MRDLERGIVRNREKDHENQIEIDGIADTQILSVFRVSYSSSPDSSASFFTRQIPLLYQEWSPLYKTRIWRKGGANIETMTGRIMTKKRSTINWIKR